MLIFHGITYFLSLAQPEWNLCSAQSPCLESYYLFFVHIIHCSMIERHTEPYTTKGFLVLILLFLEVSYTIFYKAVFPCSILMSLLDSIQWDCFQIWILLLISTSHLVATDLWHVQLPWLLVHTEILGYFQFIHYFISWLYMHAVLLELML